MRHNTPEQTKGMEEQYNSVYYALAADIYKSKYKYNYPGLLEDVARTRAETEAKRELDALLQTYYKAQLDKAVLEARINSLLDLEQWAKLHDLDAEMILDGIEHMVKSNLQVPDQPRLDHTARIAELKGKL